MLVLLPLILWILVHHIVLNRSGTQVTASRELLFFALSLCTLTLTELQDVSAKLRSMASFHTLFQATLFTINFAAVAYGAILTGDARHDVLVVQHAYHLSTAIAVTGFALSTRAQLFINQENDHAGI